MKRFRDSAGQVLLIVTIAMIVSLTVGLSVVSRSITNLKISKQNEESQRAFQAAQAGIEKALRNKTAGQITGNFSDNQANFNTKVSTADGTKILLNGGIEIPQAAGLDVWLSKNPDFSAPYSGTVTVYWGEASANQCVKNQGANTAPALEIVVLSGDKNNPTLTKYLLDGCLSRRSQNQATAPDIATDPGLGVSFSYSYSFSVASGLIMKVIPIFNSSKIGIVGGSSALPNQGFNIESTGTSGETSRKLIYFNAYPQIPAEVFPYSILSQ